MIPEDTYKKIHLGRVDLIREKSAATDDKPAVAEQKPAPTEAPSPVAQDKPAAVEAKPGDTLRVTCRFDPMRRHHGGHGIPKVPRYVLWGEGSTDEMCLGILQVTRG